MKEEKMTEERNTIGTATLIIGDETISLPVNKDGTVDISKLLEEGMEFRTSKGEALLITPKGQDELPFIEATKNHNGEPMGPDAVDATGLSKKNEIAVTGTGGLGISVPTVVSNVDGARGELTYRGIPIEELVEKTNFIEVTNLVLKGDLPTERQKEKLTKEIAENSILSEEMQKGLKNAISNIPRDANPMDMLSAGINYMAAVDLIKVDTQESIQEGALKAVAVMPVMMAAVKHHLDGDIEKMEFPKKGDFGKDNRKYDHAQNLLAMMHGKDSEKANNPDTIKIMDAIFTLHAEHGLNASTDTTRHVGSTETKEGLWRPIRAANSALTGNLHGGANLNSLNNLKELLDRPEETIKEKVSAYLQEISDFNKEMKEQGSQERKKIPGIGHRIYTNTDPRATAIEPLLDKIDNPLVEVAKELKAQSDEHEDFGKKPGRSLKPNVDFYSGVVMTEAVGIPEGMMTVMFAAGRVVGWTAHIDEQKKDEGRINRPEALYTGEQERTVEKSRANADMAEKERIRDKFINDSYDKSSGADIRK